MMQVFVSDPAQTFEYAGICIEDLLVQVVLDCVVSIALSFTGSKKKRERQRERSQDDLESYIVTTM